MKLARKGEVTTAQAVREKAALAILRLVRKSLPWDATGYRSYFPKLALTAL